MKDILSETGFIDCKEYSKVGELWHFVYNESNVPPPLVANPSNKKGSFNTSSPLHTHNWGPHRLTSRSELVLTS